MKLRAILAAGLLACFSLPLSARGQIALIRNGDHWEPLFVEVKDSLRLSLDLDSALQQLAATEAALGFTVQMRFVGPKYLERIGIPPDMTEEQVSAAIGVLEQCVAVARVLPASIAGFQYQTNAFANAYSPDEIIPEAVKRGLDTPPPSPFDPRDLRNAHVPGELIVSWKPEFVWNAAATGFFDEIDRFNAAHRCKVEQVIYSSETVLDQLLKLAGAGDAQLARTINAYISSGWVRYAEPNYYFNPQPKNKKKKKNGPFLD